MNSAQPDGNVAPLQTEVTVSNHRKELPSGIDLASIWSTPLPPLDYVVPGLVAGTIGLFMAAGGTGKSIFALELACSVAGGPDLLQLGIHKQGSVLMVAAEDPVPVLAMRLQALSVHLSPQMRAMLQANLEIIPALACGLDLFSRDGHEWELTLSRRGEGRRLIIVDTLSRAHSGQENSREDSALVMRRLERIAARTGAAVLVLHHVGKAAALNGHGDMPQAARGASVWVDEARWAAYLVGMTIEMAVKHGIDAQQRQNYLRYGIAKCNYAPPAQAIWLQRETGGILLPVTLTKNNFIRNSRPTALTHVPEGAVDEIW